MTPPTGKPVEWYRIYNPQLDAFWGRENLDEPKSNPMVWISLTNQAAWRENCLHSDNMVFIQAQKGYESAERLVIRN